MLEITVDPPVILRPGGITKEQLNRFWGKRPGNFPFFCFNGTPPLTRMNTGIMLQRGVIAYPGSPGHVAEEISRRAELYNSEGNSIGILTTDESASLYEPVLYTFCKILSLGSKKRPESLAANLFKRLREFDEAGVDVILAETPDTNGIGQAVTNRLIKASGGNIIKL